MAESSPRVRRAGIGLLLVALLLETSCRSRRAVPVKPVPSVEMEDVASNALDGAPLTAIKSISAGRSHTCATTRSGRVFCWGWNGSGQLGDGTVRAAPHPVPRKVLGLTNVSDLSVGGLHTCAIANDAAWCWGENSFGQLGDDTTTSRSFPTQVSGLSSGVSAIAAGDLHTCALTKTGTVRCWGWNDHGSLGDATSTRRTRPAAVTLPGTANLIAAGGGHTCALTDPGRAWCWGWNISGQLGIGTLVDWSTPMAVIGPDTFRKVTTGAGRSCAITMDGMAVCWGRNFPHGQLGNGTRIDRDAPTPVEPPVRDAVLIAAGDGHTCVVVRNGTVKCWGLNDAGQLGDGTTSDQYGPVPAVGGLPVVAITAGGHHSCALAADGSLVCWGSNQFGQLGDGTLNDHKSPVRVLAAQGD